MDGSLWCLGDLGDSVHDSSKERLNQLTFYPAVLREFTSPRLWHVLHDVDTAQWPLENLAITVSVVHAPFDDCRIGPPSAIHLLKACRQLVIAGRNVCGQSADAVLGVVIVDTEVYPYQTPAIDLVRWQLAFTRIR